MIKVGDIWSLTDFHRRCKVHLQHLKRTGRPMLLTINGKAELVVQDANAYERLVRSTSRRKTAIRRSVSRGESRRQPIQRETM